MGDWCVSMRNSTTKREHRRADSDLPPNKKRARTRQSPARPVDRRRLMGDPLFSYEQFTGAGGWDSGRYSVESSVEDRLMADGYSRNLEERAFMFLMLFPHRYRRTRCTAYWRTSCSSSSSGTGGSDNACALRRKSHWGMGREWAECAPRRFRQD